MIVKVGHQFIWIDSPNMGIGTVTKVWKNTKGQAFDMEFDGKDLGSDKRYGPFYTSEINDLIKYLSKLDKALK